MPQDTDFVQRLRMNNMMPGPGFNPLQAPTRQPLDVMGLLNAVGAMQSNARQQDMIQEDSMHRRAQSEHLQEVARQNAIRQQQEQNSPLRSQGGMNVVLGAGQTPAQLNGMSLDEAAAKRYDPYFGTGGAESKGQYIPEEDQPDSKKSKLEFLDKTIEGQKSVAGAKATADVTVQANKDAAAASRVAAKGKIDKDIKMSGAGQVSMIPDPDDPTKQIGVIVKPDGTVVRAKLDDDTQVGEITKSGTAPKQTAAQIKAAADAKMAATRTTDMAQKTLDSLDELLDSKTGKLNNNIKGAVGASRMSGIQYLPTSEARTANRKIKNFTSQTVLNLIGELKSQSRTGATGFGNMSNKDLAVLETAANNLDPLMSEDDFAAELGKIRKHLVKILEPVESKSPADPAAHTRLNASELIKKYTQQGVQ